MCLAIPMLVESITTDGLAQCLVGQGTTSVTASTALIEEAVKPGDYIIVHAGFALRIVAPEEAKETLKILRELAEAAEACGAFG